MPSSQLSTCEEPIGALGLNFKELIHGRIKMMTAQCLVWAHAYQMMCLGCNPEQLKPEAFLTQAEEEIYHVAQLLNHYQNDRDSSQMVVLSVKLTALMWPAGELLSFRQRTLFESFVALLRVIVTRRSQYPRPVAITQLSSRASLKPLDGSIFHPSW